MRKKAVLWRCWCALGFISLAEQAGCSPETGSQLKQSRRDGGESDTICKQEFAFTPLSEESLRQLGGRFQLSLSDGTDSTAGSLVLLPSSPERAGALGGIDRELFYGSSTVRLGELGALLAHSADSQDPKRPGAQVLFNTREKSAVLLLGGSLVPEGITLDAGILAVVQQVAPWGFGGVWHGIDSLRNPIEGIFCARRSRES